MTMEMKWNSESQGLLLRWVGAGASEEGASTTVDLFMKTATGAEKFSFFKHFTKVLFQ
jgi:hypothetical protein